MTVTLAARRSEHIFRVQAGVSIMYPFLAPAGTDTGVAATSSFATSPYVTPSSFSAHVGTWLSDVAAANGFDHVRLMVHPGPIIEANALGQASRKATLLGQITAAVSAILAAGLKVIVDLKLTGIITGYDPRLFLDGASAPNFLRYVAMLQDVAGALAAYDPNLVALELFDEPPDTTEFAGSYPAMLQQMHQAARAVLPFHTLIATCAGYSSTTSLVAFDPSIVDKNTLWSFHWYPLAAQQGDPSKDPAKWFDGADWEARKDQRAAILAKVTTRVNADASITDKAGKIASVMAAYDDMLTKGRAYFDAQCLAVRTWATNNGVSPICGEFGVTGDSPAYLGMPEASRIKYIRDVSLTLAKYGIARTTGPWDAGDHHIPGNVAGFTTLDTLTPAWKAALMADAGRTRLIGDGAAGSGSGSGGGTTSGGTTSGVTSGGTGVGDTGGVGTGSSGPGATATVDLDFVSATYTNGSPADLVIFQAAAMDVADSTGAIANYPAHTLRRNDLGVDVLGANLRFVAANAMRPANWALDALGFSNSAMIADTGPASTLFPNSRLFKTDNSGYAKVTFTEALTVGETIYIQVAWRAPRTSGGSVVSGRGADGAKIRLFWSSAAQSEGWFTADVTAAKPNYLNDTTFTQGGTNTTLVAATGTDAQGFSILTFSHVVQAADLEMRISPNTISTGSEVSIGAVQVIRGAGAGRPWHDVQTTTVVEGADTLTLRETSAIHNITQGASGWIGLEVQEVARAHLGMVGYAGSVAGMVLGWDTMQIRPAGPTAYAVTRRAVGLDYKPSWNIGYDPNHDIPPDAIDYNPAVHTNIDGWLDACISAGKAGKITSGTYTVSGTPRYMPKGIYGYGPTKPKFVATSVSCWLYPKTQSVKIKGCEFDNFGTVVGIAVDIDTASPYHSTTTYGFKRFQTSAATAVSGGIGLPLDTTAYPKEIGTIGPGVEITDNAFVNCEYVFGMVSDTIQCGKIDFHNNVLTGTYGGCDLNSLYWTEFYCTNNEWKGCTGSRQQPNFKGNNVGTFAKLGTDHYVAFNDGVGPYGSGPYSKMHIENNYAHDIESIGIQTDTNQAVFADVRNVVSFAPGDNTVSYNRIVRVKGLKGQEDCNAIYGKCWGIYVEGNYIEDCGAAYSTDTLNGSECTGILIKPLAVVCKDVKIVGNTLVDMPVQIAGVHPDMSQIKMSEATGDSCVSFNHIIRGGNLSGATDSGPIRWFSTFERAQIIGNRFTDVQLAPSSFLIACWSLARSGVATFEVSNNYAEYTDSGVGAFTGDTTLINWNGSTPLVRTLGLNKLQGGFTMGSSAGSINTSTVQTYTGTRDVATTGPLGLGGWRGIARIAVSWGPGGAWTVAANGGVIMAGLSGLSRTGLVRLLEGMSCKLRRIAGSNVRPTDIDLRDWTRLDGRVFARPGNSLAPGVSHVTFVDEFDANSLQSIPSRAFPYSNFGPMLDAYYDASDTQHAKKWKPRAHFYTSNAHGNGGATEQINHELQEYLDPAAGNGITTHEFGVTAEGRASFFRGTTGLVSALTTGQKAFVDNNPSFSGNQSLAGDAKYDFYSWMLTTAGSNTATEGWVAGGFAQKFGVFSTRAKFPTGPTRRKGAWAAFWLYNWADTSELDVQEQYGFTTGTGGNTIIAGNLHYDNFADANSKLMSANVGFDLSADFHDYTAVWQSGVVKFYLDGELMGQSTTGGTFDAKPKFLLLDMAVQPASAAPWNNADPAPDTQSRGTMPWQTLVDRVTVLQFG